MEKNQMLGHRKRLRERYFRVGYKGVEEYEILELLLTYVIKRKDCKGIAKDLLKKYKKLDRVIKADIKDLEKIDGIGKESAIFLSLIGDIFINNSYKEVEKNSLISIKGRKELREYLKIEMGNLKSEEFKVIYLNNDNKVVGEEILFKGTINRSVVYPRKIVERAIDYRARGVIFVHNHPSGNLNPSPKDIEITQEMKELLEKVDIRLIDHIIVSEDEYFSFIENQLLEY